MAEEKSAADKKSEQRAEHTRELMKRATARAKREGKKITPEMRRMSKQDIRDLHAMVVAELRRRAADSDTKEFHHGSTVGEGSESFAEAAQGGIDESKLKPLDEQLEVALKPLDEAKAKEWMPGRPLRVGGKAQQAGDINRNGRFYPAPVLKGAVDRAQPRVRANQMLMEVEHPQDKGSRGASLLETVGIVKGLSFDDLTGAVYIDEAEIVTTTEKGAHIASLALAGVPIPWSQRGRGRTRRERKHGQTVDVVETLIIDGFDFTAGPSVTDAGVSRILESMRKRRRNMKTGDVTKELLEAFRDEFPTLADVSDADLIRFVHEARQSGVEGIGQGLSTDEYRRSLAGKREMIETLLETMQEQDAERLQAIREATRAKAEAKRLEQEKLEAEEQAQQQVAEAEAKVKEAEEMLAQVQEAQRIAEAQAHGRQKVEEAEYGQKHKDLLIESFKEAKTKEEVDAILESQAKFIDASLAEEALKDMGWKGAPASSLGAITSLAESLPPEQQGASLLNEAYRDALHLPRRKLEDSEQGRVTRKLLEAFDRQYGMELRRESKEMLTRIREAQTTSQIAIPYTVSRTILEQALPEVMMLSLVDVDVAEGTLVQVPVETYAEETSGAITGSSSDIETGECEPISLARLTVTLESMTCTPKRLAAKICDEAMVFSAAQLPNYNLQARLISNIVRDIQRYIDATLIALARAAAVAQGVNNDGGPFALSGGVLPAGTDYDRWMDTLGHDIGYAKVIVVNRFWDETKISILASYTMADHLSNARSFTAAGKVPTADLDAAGYVGRIKGRPVFKTTQLDDGIILVGDFSAVKYRVWKAMEVKGPHPIYELDDANEVALVAGEYYYAQQYSAERVFTAERGKLAYVSIT